MKKIKISNQLANVGGREGETILVAERLIIHSSGESRGKHGTVLSITTLRGDRIISPWRKALPVKDMTASRFFIWCAAIICGTILQEENRTILKEENRRQKRPIAPRRVAQDRYINLYLARNDFNGWLRSWKINALTGYPYKSGLQQFARKTETRLSTLIENDTASLGGIKTQFGLLAEFSIIRDTETILGPLSFSERPPFDF